MRKYSIYALLLLLSTACCGEKELTLTVENSSSIAREGEVMAIEIENADDYVVYTKEGDILQCQTTYDGKLLFPATVAAQSTSEYIVKKGRRLALDTIATGKVYPQWYNDFGWENDKIGYRTYSEEMTKRGDKLYGYDIFTKRYDRPVLDILYGVVFDKEYHQVRSKLSKENPKAASALTTATTYHVDHGLGMDYYIVGPTLGSGTAALLEDGEIFYPKFYQKSEILDAGGLRLTFRLTYAPVTVNGEKIQEVRTITLDKGTHFNDIKVEYKNLTKPSDVVAGIVLHDSCTTSLQGEGYIAYAEPKHMYGWETYNAVIYPEETRNAIEYFAEPKGAATGHLLTYGKYTPGTPMHYYMGAGWNRWGFKTPQDWFKYVAEQAEVLAAPLTYTLK